MISILIPIHNFDIIELAKNLNEQCKAEGVEYEIVCFDDFSKKKFKEINRALDLEFGISYLELSENHGRSRIRNKLAKNARYEYLLFLDCDSGIENPDYIKNYLTHIGKSSVVYGGRIYRSTTPITEKKILHWKYGTKREALPIKARVRSPYLSFQTNNFLIRRDVMLEFPFETNISGYGYEDLVLANQLKKKGLKIIHIENPVIHINVEYTEDFLLKTKEGMENLALLYHQDKLSDTRMLKFHEKVQKIGFNSLLHKIIQRNTDRIFNNLRSKNPSLRFFDLYRYGIFMSKLSELKASSS